jgi:hypothetical protein
MSQALLKEPEAQTDEQTHDSMVVPFEKIKSEIAEIITKMKVSGGGDGGKRRNRGVGTSGKLIVLVTA